MTEPAVVSKSATTIAGREGTTYALGLLLLVYTFNFVDRNVLSIVAQPMKEELALADWQVGLLGGLAFAFFYVIMGLPIARVAERSNRVKLISILLVVWSIMTAVCGLAQSFFQILLARIGVGLGEAGCSPASHSLIADYFPPKRRATALSIYSIGVPLGPLFAGLVGGWAAQHYGWRAAFMVVGLPGIALAIVTWLTLKEPPRGRYDAAYLSGEGAPSFMTVLKVLAGKKTFLHIAFGGALATFANYGLATFATPYLLRGFDISIATAGTAYGLLTGVSAAIGTAAGGWLVDKLGARDKRQYVLIPAFGVLVSAPLYMLVLMQTDLTAMGMLVVAPAVLHYLYLGPTFGLTANMVGTRMRATASALVLLLMNLIGLGLGPLVVGILSDMFATRVFQGDDYLSTCPGGRAQPDAATAMIEMCRSASFVGLKWAMVAATLFYVWAAIHYFLGSRSIHRDLALEDTCEA